MDMETKLIVGVLIMMFGVLMLLANPISFTNPSSLFTILGLAGFAVFAIGFYFTFRELK